MTASDRASGPLLFVASGAVVASIIWALTTVAVALIMSLTSGRPALNIHRENFVWMLPHYIALGGVAGGLATVYGKLGVVGVLVLSAPLVLSRYSMKQVVDKTREMVLRLEHSNGELKLAHVEITQMSEKIREAYDGTLESLVAALDLRDHETRGHSGRVATHSLQLAKMLGIKDADELEMIYRGALMHDVGKIGIPDHILLKPGKLTEEEWVFMRRHSAMGYRILAQVPYLRPAAKVVLAHHERWDGGGYPRGLKADAIPLGARIFAISDSFDAIISDRPYRAGQSPDAALVEIQKYAGTQFDPMVVEAFEAVYPGWREETLAARKALYLPDYMEQKAAS
ncbi:MAG: HD-GYP domain-containing protein [Chloroflexi bacterium]|nr:HD-GYP domain-containing protein [Chloroflexota bacterium]